MCFTPSQNETILFLEKIIVIDISLMVTAMAYYWEVVGLVNILQNFNLKIDRWQ